MVTQPMQDITDANERIENSKILYYYHRMGYIISTNQAKRYYLCTSLYDD